MYKGSNIYIKFSEGNWNSEGTIFGWTAARSINLINELGDWMFSELCVKKRLSSRNNSNNCWCQMAIAVKSVQMGSKNSE